MIDPNLSIPITITIITIPCLRAQEYDILHIFPFSSERKRMGIIVRNRVTRGITFYMKGADAVMASIVRYSDWLDEECGNMAREGLRTLVFASKPMLEAEYRAFTKRYPFPSLVPFYFIPPFCSSLHMYAQRYNEARKSIHDRDTLVESAVQSIENDMDLLGLTGVEDKLQVSVSCVNYTLLFIEPMHMLPITRRT